MPVNVKNAARVLRRIRAVEDSVEVNLARALLRAGVRVQKPMRRGMLGHKRGRVYRAKKKWRTSSTTYKASAPGQPFASPTGNVLRAVVVKSRGFDLKKNRKSLGVRGVTSGEIAVTVGIHAPRLLRLVTFLEQGTGRVKARPTLRPVWMRLQGTIRAAIKKQVESGVASDVERTIKKLQAAL